MKRAVLLPFLLSVGVLITANTALSAEPQSSEERVSHIKSLVQERRDHQQNQANAKTSETENNEQGSGRLGIKIIEALFLCLGVFFGGIYIYRKKTGATPFRRTGRIKVVDRVIVSPKTSLLLAEVDGREILLSVGGDPVTFYQGAPQKIVNEGLEDQVCHEIEEYQKPLQRVAHS